MAATAYAQALGERLMQAGDAPMEGGTPQRAAGGGLRSRLPMLALAGMGVAASARSRWKTKS